MGIEHPTLTRCSLLLATRMLYSKTGNYEHSEEYAIELLATILMEDDCFNEHNLKYKLGLEEMLKSIDR